jgi:alkylated DNA repair dioxygenase AlkB
VTKSLEIRNITLGKGARLSIIDNFIAGDEQDYIMSLLLDESNFEQRSIRIFGRKVLQPRLIAWAGEHPYRYSGDTLPIRPFPTNAMAILGRVNSCLRFLQDPAPAFNHVLMNLYRDGNDSMGAHADDEVELGPEPFVASLSLGQPRKFQIRPKRKFQSPNDEAPTSTSPLSLDLQLESGSLVVMHPPMQRYFVHSVPKQPKIVSSRLNMTFRCVLQPPRR